MLYVVSQPNPYGIPTGTFYRLFDDGFEKCVMQVEDGRAKIVGYEGLVYPYRTLREYVTRVQRGGYDKWRNLIQ